MIKSEIEALFAGLLFLSAGHFPSSRPELTIAFVICAIIAFAIGLFLVVSGAK
jgi:hypothetical protein